jgi:tRNA(Ile)-lysidine synthase
MLKEETLSHLVNKKNLLAFSGGGDSTALFFLLLKNNIKFDIAIVDYGVRKQSKEELLYAQELADKYSLTCSVHVAPKIKQNFEAKAREIRYNFFEELIATCKYENLLTAHHLGDRFEWMLMQFCKGAGCAELAGMQSIENRDNYSLIRPLLHVDKSELFEYLRVEKIKYFEDETNLDENIKRNAFRHKYSLPLLNEHLAGIKKSFEYLDEDRALLIKDIRALHVEQFSYFKNHNYRTNIYTIDKYLKSIGYMLSAKERELLKDESTLVVGRKYVINQNKAFVFITPFIQDINMSKEFKEKMRVLHVEPKLRPYFYENEKSFEVLKELLSSI